MFKNKTIITIITSISIILVVIISVLFISKITNKNSNQLMCYGLPVSYMNAVKRYDDSTSEKAIGISDYVFIAKINKMVRTEYKNPAEMGTDLSTKNTITNPYTFYSISVIRNMKGNLITSQPIEFMQYGGLNEDKKSYTFIGSDCALLEEGGYYLLMASTWNLIDGETIEASDPNRIVYLGQNLDNNQDIINKYEQAYQNQIIPSDFVNHISKYDSNYTKK